jgi:hypothetical protein
MQLLSLDMYHYAHSSIVSVRDAAGWQLALIRGSAGKSSIAIAMTSDTLCSGKCFIHLA